MSIILTKFLARNKAIIYFPIFHRTFADYFKETRIITQNEVDRFAEISGDHNPIHKATSSSDKRCIHGAFLNAIVSGIIGTKLPGPGSIVLSQEFKFPTKCVVDQEIEICVRLVENRKILKVVYEFKQYDEIVFAGTAKLIKTIV